MQTFQVTLSNGIVLFTDDAGRSALADAGKKRDAFAHLKCAKHFAAVDEIAFIDAVEVNPAQVVSIQAASAHTIRWSTLADVSYNR
jgi:hypothetical protein